MLNRRQIIVSALAGTVILSFGTPAAAGENRAFDQKAFDAAQAAGKSILIEVSAPWCPTCKAQEPVLSRLSADARYKDVVRFNIDFDSRKDLLTKFGVRWQSTLIAFKGRTEVGRSVGDTNAKSIEALIARSI